MKVRTGFVSNSSSSSFILLNCNLSNKDLVGLVDREKAEIEDLSEYEEPYNTMSPDIVCDKMIECLENRLNYRIQLPIESLKFVLDDLIGSVDECCKYSWMKVDADYYFRNIINVNKKEITKILVKYCGRVTNLNKKLKKLDYFAKDCNFIKEVGIDFFSNRAYYPKLKSVFFRFLQFRNKAINDIYKIILKNKLVDITCFEIASDCGTGELVLLEVFPKILQNNKISFFVIRELYGLSEFGGVDRYQQKDGKNEE